MRTQARIANPKIACERAAMAQQMAFAATSRDIRIRVRPKTVSEHGIARMAGNILTMVWLVLDQGMVSMDTR